MFRCWLLFWLVAFLAVGKLTAVTHSASAAGASATISWTYSTSTGKLTYSYSMLANGTGPGGNGGTLTQLPAGQIYTTTGDGGAAGSLLLDVNNASNGATGVGSGEITLSAGSWIKVYCYTVTAAAPQTPTPSNFNPMWWQVTPSTFKVTFAIPANNTDRIIRYEIWQDGAYTGISVTTSPGDPSSEFTAHGLPNNHPATLKEVRANLVQGEDGTWFLGESSTVRVVNGGTTPVEESASNGTPGSVASPTTPVDGQPTPPPANTGATPAAPAVNVWNSSSGGPTAGGSTQAVTDSLYKEGVDKATQATANNAASVNSNANANAAAQAARDAETQSKIDAVKSAVEGLGTSLTGVKDSVDAVKGSVDAVKTAVDEHKAATEETTEAVNDLRTTIEERWQDPMEVEEAAANATEQAGTAGAAAGTAAASLFNGNAPPDSVPELEKESAILAVEMPESFGGKTFNMNPFSNDRFATICSWFRQATAWLALVTLGVWVWMQIREWLGVFSGVQQAKGNPVAGGTGAQATAFVAAGLMTAAIVTGVTGLLAWTFGDISLPAIRSAAMTNPLTTLPAQAAWMLDQLFPVATLVSCLIARLSFNMYAAPLFATCQAVVRFIVP